MNVGMVSLGCDKNRVDSEKMLFSLKNSGYTLTGNGKDADIMIVNTCAFIDKAKLEAIETVLEMAELKKGRLKYLIVTGCFAQRYGKEALLPEVDLFVNIEEEKNIAAIVDGLVKNDKPDKCDLLASCSPDRIITTPAHYAYLKIADGCDNRCSYCAIPGIRGGYRSREIEELLCEARALAENGVKELILVAQDTTNYGRDIYGKPSLVRLLTALCELDFWKIRILYAYPELIDDELLTCIANNDKIAKYLDIPLQHVDNALLKKMNRRGGDVATLINKIRAAIPDIAIRSSFICGFPYETESEHALLKSFLSNGVDYGGFFAYSPEEGTLAYDWKSRAPKRTVNRWIKECEDAQTRFTLARQDRFVGRTVEVLYEGIDFDKQLFYGRSEYSAPEVDTVVYFTADFSPEIGRVYPVKIHSAEFHLNGTALREML